MQITAMSKSQLFLRCHSHQSINILFTYIYAEPIQMRHSPLKGSFILTIHIQTGQGGGGLGRRPGREGTGEGKKGFHKGGSHENTYFLFSNIL
jgi:hypothetical protein